MQRVVVATKNKGKINEIRHILRGLGITILSLGDFKNVPKIIEDGRTFEANAAKKARIVSRCTGLLTLADDSGLEVEALDGRPGIKSARFAGEDATYKENNAKLLRMMHGVPYAKRAARFVCAIAIAKDGKVFKVVKGTCRGRIGFAPKGHAGFGYDPLFIDIKTSKTFAELKPEQKNMISHRYRALAKAKKVIERLIGN